MITMTTFLEDGEVSTFWIGFLVGVVAGGAVMTYVTVQIMGRD